MGYEGNFKMKTVDIIIPTLKRIHAFKCLQYIYEVKWPYKIHLITEGNTWAQAINIGLERVGDNDVILMDDDVMVNEDTFSLVDFYYDKADIFGFKLLFPTGLIQHAGAYFKDGHVYHYGHTERDEKQYDVPRYLCHVTTSLCYIKNDVIKSLGRMDETIPGVQFEDVDFCFRALKKGYKILYLPSPAIHLESATKKDTVMSFNEKMSWAYSDIVRKHLTNKEFVKYLESFPKDLDESKVEVNA